MKQNDPFSGNGEVRLIRKANELVEARYRYDIWETRIFAHVVSLVRNDDADFHEYKIFVRDIIRAFGIDEGGKAYRALIEGAKGLVNKKLFIERERDGKPTELETWLFTSAEYFKDDSEGSHIIMTFHPALKPYLLELKQRFLVYDIRNILRLTSAYSVRMYELLKQYERLGKRTFDIENLKLTLGILEHEYKLYGHFKDKVILKSQLDLSQETDISFDFVEHKQGKKVKSITFRIFANGQGRAAAALPKAAKKARAESRASEKSTQIDSPFFEQALRTVGAWGVSATVLRNFLAEHGEERVGEAIRLINEQLEKGKKIGNPAGYFSKAVAEGWASAAQTKTTIIDLKKAEIAEREAVLRAQMLEKIAVLEAELEQMLAERRTESNAAIRDLTNQDPFLAAAAVNGILADSFSRAMLESQTGLTVETLQLDDWRSNRQLRDAVMRQIERMHPEDFRAIQNRWDAPILKARKAIDALKREQAKKG